MKPIFKNVLVSFATGASFTLGVCAIILAYESFQYSREGAPSTKVYTPDELSIVEHELVPGREKSTVQGVVENSGGSVWSFALVNLRVYAGDALMSGCSIDLTDIQPNSSRQFELACSTTQGLNLPDNISYVIEVPWGWRFD